MKRLVLLLTVAALASPAGAEAKGWITFLAPSGRVEVGESFNATLQFPVGDDAQVPQRPELVFVQLDSNVKRRFSAEPTRKHGSFRARVSLPRAGAWTVYVYAYEMGSVALHPSSNQFVVRPAAAAVKATKLPGTVAAGDDASLTVKVAPKARCTIKVVYDTVTSRAKGLGAKTGTLITWRWRVGSNTLPGRWPITIDCGNRGASCSASASPRDSRGPSDPGSRSSSPLASA
jgi:hypothetical protein